MRITNTNMINSYLKDIQRNLQSMDKISTQLNNGKQINKISDDPLKAVKILNMNNEISDTEKYNSNCDEITGWLDITDGALDSIGTLTSEIKTLLTSISGTFGESEIKATNEEITEKIKQIGEAMNTTYAGKYIFGGSKTDEAPVKIIKNDDGTIQIDINNNNGLNDKLNGAVSNGIDIDYNLTIENITKTESSSGLNILKEISSKLNSEPLDMDKISELTKGLDNYLNDILNNRSIVGAKTNTINKIKDANDENILKMKETLSLIQDVDVAEKYIELKSAEMVYTSSLQVGSKLFQNTLLDYLR